MTTVEKLFEEAEIDARVAELAKEITERMTGDFTIVGLLYGSFVFVADLVRALYRVGAHPRVVFVRLSSYGKGTESSGRVRLLGNVPEEIEGRPILLVDDIADTGRSLAYAKELLEEGGATEIRTCALVDKPSRRLVLGTPDFVGFTIEDVFIVGYGIDYADDYRHLPYIGYIT